MPRRGSYLESNRDGPESLLSYVWTQPGHPIEPTLTDRSFDPVALALLLRPHFPIIKTEHWGPHG